MRITKDQWAMNLAIITSQRSTCFRRNVGCVLLDRAGHVLSTGYNGVASGMPHCNHHDPFAPEGYPFQCPGAHAESGKDLDGCQAIHAEQNALLQCKDPSKIYVAYVTASPCMTCTKLLLNTPCEQIIFIDEYPHNEAKQLWLKAGRTWGKYTTMLPTEAPDESDES